MRMGYFGYVNDLTYNKSKFSMPYKFLVHSTIHALHNRKGAFDVSSDFVMCAIFNYMVDNIHGEKFLQYPQFIQMILDDKVKNLPKVDADELILDHMDAETLKRMSIYQGVETDKEPPYKKQFAAIQTM
ncbi:hypothetical protein HanHA300_Chr03g0077781 [Helianthus annuus]|nr:hypothetical protein HanHA300_Chr03g0077781 [Helianthus annuus]KAJ0599141.1 hypothetical protein HanIR_Chr03g0101511 [Helianthus annuus]KAJ0772713.1 hypothetical protein HanOQP8_Chr03g0090551 [Helianthus annuus]KAJ0942227.1 hypothetical protein HanPSC8_Chr03g0089461 [Helianthus annuus]